MTQPDGQQLGRTRLAEAVKAARLAKGWGKEEAARRAGISSITWDRVERGLPVRDEKEAAVGRALGWHPNAVMAVRLGGEPYAEKFYGGPSEQPVTEKNSGPEAEIDRSSVGDDSQDEEIVFRLRVQPGASPRERDRARRAAEAAARAVLEDLDEE